MRFFVRIFVRIFVLFFLPILVRRCSAAPCYGALRPYGVGPGQPTPSQPSIGCRAKKTTKIAVSAHMKAPISRALP